MNEIAKQTLDSAMSKAIAPDCVYWSKDLYGNAYGWLRLEQAELLAKAAPALAAAGARLCTITAYRADKFARIDGREIAYHFDLDGIVITVTVVLDEADSSVPSITRWFLNADWNEREFMELYDIKVTGHPNPRRLFLDNELDKDQLDRLVPLSTMMNGACTKTLWEKVFAGGPMPAWAKGGN